MTLLRNLSNQGPQHLRLFLSEDVSVSRAELREDFRNQPSGRPITVRHLLVRLFVKYVFDSSCSLTNILLKKKTVSKVMQQNTNLIRQTILFTENVAFYSVVERYQV